MPQVFPKSMNSVARIMVLGLPLLAGSGVVAGAAFYRSDYTTGAREVVEQPVPFSHKHHVGQLGIDCRYCHTVGRDVRLRRHPADQDVHELPPADVGRGRPARARSARATQTDTADRRGTGSTTSRTTPTSTTRSTSPRASAATPATAGSTR